MSSLQEQLAKLQSADADTTQEKEDSTFGRVRELLVKVTGADPESIGPSSSLREDLAVTSLDVVELAVRTESTFGIHVDQASGFQQFTTVQDIVDFVEDHQNP